MPTTRREFLRTSGSCAAHLAFASALMPSILRAAWANAPLGPVIAREPFGTLEKVADGVWALISSPLGGDRTTLSNGGLIAGRNGVLAIEGFNQPAGAAWLAAKSRELTGRWPTHVVVTHYHGDHSNGLAGYRTPTNQPTVRATAVTHNLVLTRNAADAARADALKDITAVSADEPSTLDLGGRTVRFVPREGHTASDVTVEIDDPAIVFCGDLVWNAMVPNYVDAVPSRLSAAVRSLRRPAATVYVPGHGALAREPEFTRYVSVLDEIEKVARGGRAAGKSASEAAAGFTLPASLGTWTLFSPQYFERAIGAWYKELP
jgi:glyoxylase-like metal-dependent hydrolase (beta-lactamase superfamily II)